METESQKTSVLSLYNPGEKLAKTQRNRPFNEGYIYDAEFRNIEDDRRSQEEKKKKGFFKRWLLILGTTATTTTAAYIWNLYQIPQYEGSFKSASGKTVKIDISKKSSLIFELIE